MSKNTTTSREFIAALVNKLIDGTDLLIEAKNGRQHCKCCNEHGALFQKMTHVYGCVVGALVEEVWD